MVRIMETVGILVISILSFFCGMYIAKGIDNNHRELFQAYMDEQLKLSIEKQQTLDVYNQLVSSINNSDLVDDWIMNCRGQKVGVIFKKDKFN